MSPNIAGEAPSPATTVPLGPMQVFILPPDSKLPEPSPETALSPSERDHAATIRHPDRRAEYVRTRWLLRRLIGPTAPLTRDQDGVTTWPDGIRGSITHKNGLVAVALAPASGQVSLGVDIEDSGRLRVELADRLVVPEEAAVLTAALADWTGALRLALAFSVKESLFKCLYPLGRRMFWFHDAVISGITPEGLSGRGRLSIELTLDASPQTPAGTCLTGFYERFPAPGPADTPGARSRDRGDWLLTGVTLPVSNSLRS